MKTIIYYRKSTDRDDKQANSLEHQLGNCRRISKMNNLEVIEEIWESKSAKTEWTREWFNRLIKLCKTWKIDYIVIDEAKRLSRNNLDSARIIDLFDKKLIKWIYSTWRVYLANQISDVFLLQLDLSLSKMDNAHRSKEVSDKMQTCINNSWRFLRKAPFWYKNITLKKWHKDIVIDEKEAKIVKEIYNLRLEKKAYRTIGNIIKLKYGWKINLDCSASRMHQVVKNKFYYGVFTWNKKEYIWSHKPLVTKEIYDKAWWVWTWVYECTKKIDINEITPKSYYFKWLIKDSFSYKLTCYEKKWFTYYSNQSRSPDHISINENMLFDLLWEAIKNNDTSDWNWKSFDKKLVESYVEKFELNNWNELLNIDKQIETLREKQEKLLDLKLDDVIDENKYILKHNQLESEIKEYLDQKFRLKNENFRRKTQIMLELAENLYTSYISLEKNGKIYIIKKLMLELFINNKKELQIVENPLFETLKFLKIIYGSPTESNIRTFKLKLSMIDLEDLKEFNNFLGSWNLYK